MTPPKLQPKSSQLAVRPKNGWSISIIPARNVVRTAVFAAVANEALARGLASATQKRAVRGTCMRFKKTALHPAAHSRGKGISKMKSASRTMTAAVRRFALDGRVAMDTIFSFKKSLGSNRPDIRAFKNVYRHAAYLFSLARASPPVRIQESNALRWIALPLLKESRALFAPPREPRDREKPL